MVVYLPIDVNSAVYEIYTDQFHKKPNRAEFNDINVDVFYAHVTSLYAHHILVEYKDRDYSQGKNMKYEMCRDNSICIFKTGEMIKCHSGHNRVDYYYDSEDLFSIEQLKELALEFAYERELTLDTIHILTKTSTGFDFKPFTISKNIVCDIENYNDDLAEFDCHLCKNLQNSQSGLYLFHGKPGTGKTTYIRHLIKNQEREILYIPSNMAESLASAEFIALLKDKEDSIIVIEDAEKALISRTVDEYNHAVSTLLNLTDGILGDALKLQIICTFNCELNQIDSALLRPGRLKGLFEFKPLTVKKAQKLSQKLGQNRQITQPLTFAEVYNENNFEYDCNVKSIGFK